MLIFLTLACGKDPAESAVETATPPTPTPSESETEETADPACPAAGTWSLEQALCDGVDVTADVRAAIPSVTAIVATSPSEGCFIELWLASDTCVEGEQADATHVSGDSWSMLGFGVTSCKPVGCDFGGGDLPCKLGDRAGTWSETMTVDGTTVTTTRTGGGLCAAFGADETTLVWTLTPAPPPKK